MKNYSVEQIFSFLNEVDSCFPIPLSQKQDLAIFSKKLYEKATVCAVCEGDIILAMAAGYTDNLTDNKAYISVVATLQSARGQGYATDCIKQFIEICRNKKINFVHLYTDKNNVAAQKMYKKIGFVEYIIDNEPRPNDLHLIYYLQGEKKI